MAMAVGMTAAPAIAKAHATIYTRSSSKRSCRLNCGYSGGERTPLDWSSPEPKADRWSARALPAFHFSFSSFFFASVDLAVPVGHKPAGVLGAGVHEGKKKPK